MGGSENPHFTRISAPNAQTHALQHLPNPPPPTQIDIAGSHAHETSGNEKGNEMRLGDQYLFIAKDVDNMGMVNNGFCWLTVGECACTVQEREENRNPILMLLLCVINCHGT